MLQKTSPLDELCASTGYDVCTARYLDEAAIIAGCATGARADDDEAPPPHQAEFARLDEALRESGIIDSDNPEPLPESARTPSGHALLEHAIDRLTQRLPEVASARMRELGYLANVLFAAAQCNGRPMTERAAARVAIATAALGASRLMQQIPKVPNGTTSQLEEILCSSPGVIRLFQVGFHLLSLVPLACCRAIYLAKDVQSRRRGHVAYLEMEEILAGSRLTELVQEGRYGEAKSVIDGLTAVMDSSSCVVLRMLVDTLPAFPQLLSGVDTNRATYVNRQARPIDRMEDLELIHDFLAALARGETRDP